LFTAAFARRLLLLIPLSLLLPTPFMLLKPVCCTHDLSAQFLAGLQPPVLANFMVLQCEPLRSNGAQVVVHRQLIHAPHAGQADATEERLQYLNGCTS